MMIASGNLFQFGNSLLKRMIANQSLDDCEVTVNLGITHSNDAPLQVVVEEEPMKVVEYLWLQKSCWAQ